MKAEASASKLLLDWADLEAWAYWKRAGRAAQQLLLTEPIGPLDAAVAIDGLEIARLDMVFTIVADAEVAR